MANGSQHMTIGRVCYRCHGWAGSLEAGPKFLEVSTRGYDFAVMRAPAHSLSLETGARPCPSLPVLEDLGAGTYSAHSRSGQPCLPYARKLWIVTNFLSEVPLSVRLEK